MRRLLVLLAVVVGVAFIGVSHATMEPRAGRQDPGCSHFECFVGQCQEVFEPGVDDCSACPESCDPDGSRFRMCTDLHGTWDPDTCGCTGFNSCTDEQNQACADQWGTLDPVTCDCTNTCDPGAWIEVGWDDFYDFDQCIDCDWAQYIHTEVVYYERYCTDGRLYDDYSAPWDETYQDFCADCWLWCWEW